MIITGSGLINGTESKDRITGSDARDTIYGLGGNDEIFAHAGDDLVEGGYGNDSIQGNDGVDTLYGGGGGDTLSGGGYFGGGGGGDQLFGEAGNDAVMSSGSGNLLDGGDGNDTILFDNHAKVAGDNLILAGAGNDWVRAEQSGKGELTIDLGADYDYLQLIGRARATVTGGAGDDHLVIWSPKKLVAFGGEGNDHFELALPDLPGGTRLIKAGKGDDIVDVRAADDWELVLGGGRDTVNWRGSTDTVTANELGRVLDFEAGVGGDAVDLAYTLMYEGTYWNGEGDAFEQGRLRLVQDGADTRVEVDLDAGGSEYGWDALMLLKNRSVGDFHADNFKGYDPDLQP